jgi:hypothetical protein
MSDWLHRFVRPDETAKPAIVVSLFVCLLLAGCVQFGVRVLRTPLAVDEAESAINAWSILERGYPGDQYLGAPIYENMLVRPWPENPEYEFKDVSYSDRGVAVYHGWLPLYAIAGSFRLLGVLPPRLEPGWRVTTDLPRFKWRTLAARAPSLVVGVLLLVVLFLAARREAGPIAALAMLVLAGQSNFAISAVVFARYYALTLLLSALAWLSLRKLAASGQWRNHAAHGVVLLALFYTSILTCLTLGILTTGAMLMADRPWLALRRWTMVVLVLAALGLPWVVFTGFIQHLQYVPSGASLLHFPGDALTYTIDRFPHLVMVGGSVVWFLWLSKRGGGGSHSYGNDQLPGDARCYALLWMWIAIAGCLWWFLTPAASLFPQRLSLSLFVPASLLTAIVIGQVSRSIAASWRSTVLAPVIAFLFLVVCGAVHLPPPSDWQFEKLQYTFELLNGLNLQSDARVYASPGSHLVLSFYGDKPIQSLAPIRTTFLSSYPGEVVYVEGQLDWEFSAPGRDDLQDAAGKLGEILDESAARQLESQLKTRFAREQVQARMADINVVPPLEPLSPVAETAMAGVRRRALALAAEEQERWEHVPFSRGLGVRTGADLWEVFFYRLVNPDSRRGIHLNAADRLRGANAYFIPVAQRVVFYSPRPALP